MPRPEERRSQVLAYLYERRREISARELVEQLGLSKQTVYQVIEDLTKKGYLDVTIAPEDRIRRYRLRDNYREWFRKGEELDVSLPFMKESRRRLPAVSPRTLDLLAQPQSRFDEVTDPSKGIDALFTDATALRLLSTKEVETLREAKRILSRTRGRKMRD